MDVSVFADKEDERLMKSFFRQYKKDLLWAGVLMLLLAAGLVAFLLFRTGGRYVKVQIGDTVVACYPLNEDRTERFYQEGIGENTVCIADGKASVILADCPDKICERSGTLSYAGESAVCLPHRFVILIVDTYEEPEKSAPAAPSEEDR